MHENTAIPWFSFFFLACSCKKRPAHNYATMWIVWAQLICMHLTDATFHRPGYEKWLSLSVCSLLVPLEVCSSVPPRLFVYWFHFIYRSGQNSLSVDGLCNKHLSNDRVEALNAEVQHAEAAHYRYNAAFWWRPIVTSLIVDFQVDCNHFWSLDLKSNTNRLNPTLRQNLMESTSCARVIFAFSRCYFC